LPRVLAGPITGFMVDAIGWSAFFLSTLVLGIPGLVMLARFVPPGVREPVFAIEEVRRTASPPSTASLALRGAIGAVVVGTGSFALVALLDALKVMRDNPAVGFSLGPALFRAANPVGITDWVQLIGIVAAAIIGGVFVAAAIAARHGIGEPTADEDAAPPQTVGPQPAAVKWAKRR
jgi:PAT family beta-lactamase induction signal transducer AmpG